MNHLSYRAIITNHPNLLGSLLLAIVLLPLLLLFDLSAASQPANINGITLEASLLFSSPWILPLLVAIILVANAIYLVLWVRLYRYEVTDDAFEKEYGVIAKDYVSIPYRHINNVNIERSLLERLLGISSVEIQTAGSEELAPEGDLPGIPKRAAQRLRDELLARADT